MDTRSFPSPESVDIVVIGGGQAGLALGYHLTRSTRIPVRTGSANLFAYASR